jgi:hypothetical protein
MGAKKFLVETPSAGRSCGVSEEQGFSPFLTAPVLMDLIVFLA